MDILIQEQLAEYKGVFAALGTGPLLPLLFVLACGVGYFLTRNRRAGLAYLSASLVSSVIVGAILAGVQIKGWGLAALFLSSLGLFASLFAWARSREGVGP